MLAQIDRNSDHIAPFRLEIIGIDCYLKTEIWQNHHFRTIFYSTFKLYGRANPLRASHWPRSTWFRLKTLLKTTYSESRV